MQALGIGIPGEDLLSACISFHCRLEVDPLDIDQLLR
jgi:hypothetical protein